MCLIPSKAREPYKNDAFGEKGIGMRHRRVWIKALVVIGIPRYASGFQKVRRVLCAHSGEKPNRSA